MEKRLISGDVFGWEYKDWSSVTGSPYLGIMTAPMDSKEPGINGGLLKRTSSAPKPEQGTNAFVCTGQERKIKFLGFPWVLYYNLHITSLKKTNEFIYENYFTWCLGHGH